MSCRHGILILALLLVGCGPVRTEIKEVKVPVTKYVPVPAKYTQNVLIAEPEATKECGPADTVCELRNVAHKRKLGLETCNGQLDSIQYIQGSDVNGN